MYLLMLMGKGKTSCKKITSKHCHSTPWSPHMVRETEPKDYLKIIPENNFLVFKTPIQAIANICDNGSSFTSTYVFAPLLTESQSICRIFNRKKLNECCFQIYIPTLHNHMDSPTEDSKNYYCPNLDIHFSGSGSVVLANQFSLL